MDLDAEIDMRPDRLAHGADIGDGGVGRLRVDEEARLPERVPLDRRVSHLNDCDGALRELLRRLRAARPAIGVGADAVAALAAEQFIHRHAERLALDVPERVIDGADRRIEHRPADPEGTPIHLVPVLLDAGGSLPTR